MGTIQTQLLSMPLTFYVIKDEDIDIPSDALIGMTILKWSSIDFPNQMLKFKHKHRGENTIALLFEQNTASVNNINNNEIREDIDNSPTTQNKTNNEKDEQIQLLLDTFKQICGNAKALFKENETRRKHFVQEIRNHIQTILCEDSEEVDYLTEVKKIWEEVINSSMTDEDSQKGSEDEIDSQINDSTDE